MVILTQKAIEDVALKDKDFAVRVAIACSWNVDAMQAMALDHRVSVDQAHAIHKLTSILTQCPILT